MMREILGSNSGSDVFLFELLCLQQNITKFSHSF